MRQKSMRLYKLYLYLIVIITIYYVKKSYISLGIYI